VQRLVCKYQRLVQRIVQYANIYIQDVLQDVEIVAFYIQDVDSRSQTVTRACAIKDTSFPIAPAVRKARKACVPPWCEKPAYRPSPLSYGFEPRWQFSVICQILSHVGRDDYHRKGGRAQWAH